MNKKRNFTIITMLICLFAAAQSNKPEAGDFGMRYGVSFNGAATQTIAFSGMLTNKVEFGCGLNVQYSATTTSGITRVSINYNSNNSYDITTETNTSSIKTLNVGISPFLVYHFPIKSNIDIYSGGKLIIGTGPHTISNEADQTTQSTYYGNGIEYTTTNKYPWGFQVGGGIILGGRYFFYKRLALGFEANVGATYSATKGNIKATSQAASTGGGNGNSVSYEVPYTAHAFSVTTASNIGLNLTFYLSKKVVVVRKAKDL